MGFGAKYDNLLNVLSDCLAVSLIDASMRDSGTPHFPLGNPGDQRASPSQIKPEGHFSPIYMSLFTIFSALGKISYNSCPHCGIPFFLVDKTARLTRR